MSRHGARQKHGETVATRHRLAARGISIIGSANRGVISWRKQRIARRVSRGTAALTAVAGMTAAHAGACAILANRRLRSAPRRRHLSAKFMRHQMRQAARIRAVARRGIAAARRSRRNQRACGMTMWLA